jgi:hypothetical protein
MICFLSGRGAIVYWEGFREEVLDRMEQIIHNEFSNGVGSTHHRSMRFYCDIAETI